MVNRQFKPMTINKFKGMNTGFLGTSAEQYSQEDDEMVDITNFNMLPDGYLEKRPGAQLRSTITTTPPSSVHIVGMQRTRVGTLSNRLIVTDGLNTWRIECDVGTVTRLTTGGGPLAALQSFVEYGGTAPADSYNGTGLRNIVGHTTPTASGGIIGFFGDSTVDQTGWVANTPMGTQIVVFKNRGWVINSFGAYMGDIATTAGFETKVWYSEPGNLGNFGGAGAPNNFNLDFADGDFTSAMVVFNDQLLCFKTRKTFIVSADGQPSDWQQRLVSDRIGCVGRGTVKVINGIVYFLSMDGVMRTDGTTFENISGPIADFLRQHSYYVNPGYILDKYASYWDQKYILWLPDAARGLCDTALVYDLRTEGWSRWVFTGGVTPFGEAVWDEHSPSTLFIGSWNSNRIYQMGVSYFTDNGINYDCSFTTKKYDLGSAMVAKRNHLVGLTVTPNAINRGMYKVAVTADDTTVTTRTEAPPSAGVMNLKAKGAGYGRYFQAVVTQNSSQYAAVYDLTLMNEDRGFIRKSTPIVPAPPVDIPLSLIFNMGLHQQDKLDSGMKMG